MQYQSGFSLPRSHLLLVWLVATAHYCTSVCPGLIQNVSRNYLSRPLVAWWGSMSTRTQVPWWAEAMAVDQTRFPQISLSICMTEPRGAPTATGTRQSQPRHGRSLMNSYFTQDYGGLNIQYGNTDTHVFMGMASCLFGYFTILPKHHGISQES